MRGVQRNVMRNGTVYKMRYGRMTETDPSKLINKLYVSRLFFIENIIKSIIYSLFGNQLILLILSIFFYYLIDFINNFLKKSGRVMIEIMKNNRH